MTKQAVTIGCGSTNGRSIIDSLLDHDYHVTNIGSSSHPHCENIMIEWNKIDITNLHKVYRTNRPIDFIFFNQNGSSLSHTAFDLADTLEVWTLLKDWKHTHWISCQMPFLFIHYAKKHLHAESKIGWMLSSTMRWNNPQSHNFPDYASQKYFNYLAMKSWAKHFETFGIFPDFNLQDAPALMTDIMRQILSKKVKSTVFDMHAMS